jgi:F-actin capping protein alpha subunit
MSSTSDNDSTMTPLSTFASDLWQSLPPLDENTARMLKPDMTNLLGWTPKDSSSPTVQVLLTSLKNVELVESTDALPTPYESIREEMEKQVMTFYREKRVSSVSFQLRRGLNEQQESCLLVSTMVTMLDTNNYTAGSWQATHLLNTVQHTIQGTVNLHTYYYEDGANVQMRSCRNYETIPVEDPVVAQARAEKAQAAAAEKEKKRQENSSKKWAISDETTAPLDELDHVKTWSESVVKQVMVWNAQLCRDLTELLSSDGGALEQVVRTQVRRVLPITKQRMKWSDAAQRNVRLLRATVQAEQN